MPDYIYLLENRLSLDQQNAVRQLREAAREAEMILFLTGDAVRDLTSGHGVRDLEITVHGNALKLKKIVEKLGGAVWGESEFSRSLYLCFPGTVRVDVVSMHRVEYPKPGKPVIHPASIQEDLRRRDFTVNAMAISLNEGSFGLLMDPLNGVADIEARVLRLVSNYGFLEEPSLLIRATRYLARLGWEFDPKTRTRYENAMGEGVIEHLSAEARSQELEQIGHEEDGLKVLRALEAEGWMNVLFPAWTAAKADEERLKVLHDLAVDLLLQGVHADMSAAQMQLLTARLAPKELAALKKLMLRPGFVEEWNSLDALAAGFAKVLLSKENAAPSARFKLFTSYDPEAILWLEFTSKSSVVLEHFNQFLKVWPEFRQRIPHAQMQEMRITHELPAYLEIVQAVFLELIDGRLTTPEEIRTFLEPHSPPAPPPQVTIKRPRAKRGAEAKIKEHSYDDDEEREDSSEADEDLDDIGGDDDEVDLGLTIPTADLDTALAEEGEVTGDDDLDAEEPEQVPAAVKRAARSSAPPEPATKAKPTASAPVPINVEKPLAKPNAGKAQKAEVPRPVSHPKSEPKPGSKQVPTPKPDAGKAKPQAASPKAKPVQAPAPAKAKPPAPVKMATPTHVEAKGSKPAKPTPAATRPVARKATVKVPAKVPPKVPVKVPVKVPAKVPVKVVAKTAAKAPAKTPVKAVAKSVPAKGKPAPAAISKAAKSTHAAKPSKPAEKKAAPKPGKKH
jgi:tRNA nucleotidyltransferase (CCA-adding enzyme)